MVQTNKDNKDRIHTTIIERMQTQVAQKYEAKIFERESNDTLRMFPKTVSINQVAILTNLFQIIVAATLLEC